VPGFTGLIDLGGPIYRWSARPVCGNLPNVRIKFACAALDEILPMDMAPKEIVEFLQSTARSIGAEVASPWFYLQVGLILTAAGIAYAADAHGST
jgi:hypothetical protein